MKIIKQAALIPFRYHQKGLEILLITSLRKKKWIIPKGIVEEGQTDRETAQKEAFEEAGIEGNLSPDLWGHYEEEKWGGLCRIKVYAMEVCSVADHWPECDQRRRKWVEAPKAAQWLTNRKLKKIVQKFIEHMHPEQSG